MVCVKITEREIWLKTEKSDLTDSPTLFYETWELTIIKVERPHPAFNSSKLTTFQSQNYVQSYVQS